jgi:hypothetical protein
MSKIQANINVDGDVYEIPCPPDSTFKTALIYATNWIKWKLDTNDVNPEYSILQWDDTHNWVEIGHKHPN